MKQCVAHNLASVEPGRASAVCASSFAILPGAVEFEVASWTFAMDQSVLAGASLGVSSACVAL